MNRKVTFQSNGDPSVGIAGQQVDVDYVTTDELEPEEIDALNQQIAEVLGEFFDDKFRVYNE